jgi:hypothetical protein
MHVGCIGAVASALSHPRRFRAGLAGAIFVERSGCKLTELVGCLGGPSQRAQHACSRTETFFDQRTARKAAPMLVEQAQGRSEAPGVELGFGAR